MKIFISYSRDDKAFVYEFAQKLRDEGQHDVWIDRRLVGADLWWQTILEAIENCECFVTIMTPKCVSSIYCNGELDYGLTLKKPILPLMLKPCDLPSSLKAVQYTDINGLSIVECLLRAEKALSRVEIRLIKGEYPALTEKPPRPPVPEPQANPEHVYEVFSAAEEALAASDSALAEKLFAQVIQADPAGLGVAAAERLVQMRLDRERAIAYTQIVKLAENPATLKGARAAWKVYAQKYGLDHDPNGYALKLSDKAAAGGESPGQNRLDSKGIPQVWVPSGCFLMGSEPTDVVDFPDEQPQHEVCIKSGFWIDQYLVTNEAFQKFIDDGGYQKREYWSGAGWRWVGFHEAPGPQNYDGFTDPRLPRVGLTYYEAEAYAKWRGGRLPTEAEWEFAARGPQSLIYPWGNDYDGHKLNTENDIGHTTPVENYPGGKSWIGAYDMAGNAWQWVSDWYDKEYYRQEVRDNPPGPSTGDERVVRGGGYDFNRIHCRTAYRFKSPLHECSDNIGFRVVTNG